MAFSVNMVASLVHTISSHNGDVNGVAYTEGKLASISSDKTVRLWSSEDYSELPCSPLHGHKYNINYCTFSPFGTTLATCSTDGTVKLWDTKTGQIIGSLQHESKNSIRVCKFSPRGNQIATGSDDDSICLWDVSSKQLVRSFSGLEDTVVTLSYSPDGHFLVSGSSNGDLHVWDAAFGHGQFLFLKVDAHDLGVMCSEFSPTSGSARQDHVTEAQLLLATGGKDNLVKLWTFQATIGSVDVELNCHAELPGHSDSVMSCAFSPNGRVLATVSVDKSARFWDPVRGLALFSIDRCHERIVTSCAFSATGTHLATASMDRTVRVWKLTNTNSIMNGLSGYEEPEVVVQGGSCVDVPHPMAGWSVEDVVQWLGKLGLSQYGDRFRSQAIDGTELLTLTRISLTSIGVDALGHRNKIIRSRDAADVNPEPERPLPSACAMSSTAEANEKDSWKFVDLRAPNNGGQGPSFHPSGSSTTPSRQWTVDNVVQWLGTMGLSQYAASFQQHAIDGRELFTLTDMDLEKTVGVAVMGHRNKILRGRDAALQLVSTSSPAGKPASKPPLKTAVGEGSADVHNEFLCPITMEIMRDPVIAADGYTYDRGAIEAWFDKGKDRSPMTNAVLNHRNLIPNRTLKTLIQKHVEEHGH